jgi:HEPN domain-containing protein
MKQATRAWFDKAEGDLLLAQQSLATSSPVYDGICFHAQQCAEKYLKGLLQEHGQRFPRTHELSDLGSLASALAPGLRPIDPDLRWLTDFAVDTRYPGSSATQADATRAMDVARHVRALVRAALTLPP